MKDIAYFLEAAGEPEYAAEVLNAHNRLEAFADGLDKAALDCAIKAAEEAIKQRDDLLAALTDVVGAFGTAGLAYAIENARASIASVKGEQ